MGDQWEESRLDRREAFRDSHRLRLDPETSSNLVANIEAIDALTSELLVAVKQLKSALRDVSHDSATNGTETLREAFTKCINEPAIMEGDAGIEFSLNQLAVLSTGFGQAISAIMTINRCVLSLNNEKAAYASLKNNVHKEAVAQTGDAYEFGMKAIEVELSHGELFVVAPMGEISKLALVSMDLTIEQLATWKAVDGKQGGWRPHL